MASPTWSSHRRRVETIVLAGPVGNPRVEARRRDFFENGLELTMLAKKKQDRMRAIVLREVGGPEGFVMNELPLPPLRAGDVRIRVRAVAFNPVDVQICQGSIGIGDSAILGRDLSGVVDDVHADVTEFRPGDEVFSNVCRRASSGTYAEFVSVPAELVARKPQSLSHEQAAAVPVAAITATLAVRKLGAGVSRSLFVAGASGGVGSFAILLARQLGATRIVATAGSPASRSYLSEQLGLSESMLVDYRDGDVVAQALERNGGPFDGALDLVGGAMLAACCRLVDIDGAVASVTEAPVAQDLDLLFERNASFHAIGAHASSLSDDRRRWRRYQQILEGLATQFDQGSLEPPCVTRVGPFSVDSVQRAFALLGRSAVRGKLVMCFE